MLGKNLPAAIGEQIEALQQDPSLNMDAFRLEPAFSRIYPDGELAAHVLGFVNLEGQANYGLEQYYDRQLQGVEGTWRGISDSLGEQILASLGGYQPARDGTDLVLTIDRNVQYMAEQILREGVEEHKAAAASMIVVDPRTGGVLAITNQPTYNPNSYGDAASQESYINQAITSLYEPGSVLKVMTLAAALQERVIHHGPMMTGRIVWQSAVQNSTKGARADDDRVVGFSERGAAHVASLLGATRLQIHAALWLWRGDALTQRWNRDARAHRPERHMSDLGTNSYGRGLLSRPSGSSWHMRRLPTIGADATLCRIRSP